MDEESLTARQDVQFAQSASPLCRICAADASHGGGIFVFSDRGKQSYLQAKVRKYLYITVSMDDKLSKIICDNCCNKIEGIHKFATMATKTQDKFNKLILNDDSSVPQSKQIENKGLLHTYLTTGIIETKPNRIDDTAEEMEVRLDPMLFLQYRFDEEQMTATNFDEDVDNDNDNDTEGDEDIYKSCSKTCNSEFAIQNHVWSHHVATPRNKRIVLNNHNQLLQVDNNYPNAEPGLKEKSDLITLYAINYDQCNGDDDDEDGEDGGSENGTALHFTCPICGKHISTKGNLKVHLETHRPKGKYGCDSCGRIFKTQCNLHRHKEYHTGIQFTCKVCGRVYPTNSTLRAHSITHSDLRPHKCPLCDKTFKRNQDLKFHINQHTGARPYKCPYCPKAFASSGNCFSHRKRMHPQEVERDREKAAKILP